MANQKSKGKIADLTTKEQAEIKNVGQTSVNEQKETKRESTRSHIALVYVVAFLFIAGGALAFGLFQRLTAVSR